MLISVFTPTHDTRFLAEAYESLKKQSYEKWEWLIVLNGNARASELNLPPDGRVRVITALEGLPINSIGALKRYACDAAHGQILLELDHDDLLVSHALECVADVFTQYPGTGFVYSNCAMVNGDGSSRTFDPAYGWETRIAGTPERPLIETIAPRPEPQNLLRILFAPDHLRAWSKAAYVNAGGHDADMHVGDDHDLVCRTYLTTRMRHIDECLYVYRVHGDNSWLKRVDQIQQASWSNYEKYKWQAAMKWAAERGLKCIDLCGGLDSPDGFVSVDLQNADVVTDLNGRWPFDDNSVGVIRAFDALEHLRDPVHSMNEAWRVLAHGGFLFSMTPSTDGRGAFQDPTHVSFWNENSFWYYTKSSHRRYIEPRAQCRFQAARIRTFFPNEFCHQNNISYVQADLTTIKQGPRFHGLLEI